MNLFSTDTMAANTAFINKPDSLSAKEICRLLIMFALLIRE